MDPLEAQLRRQTERSRDFFWHRLRWRAVASYLPGDRPIELLDIGAGAGLLGDFLARSRPLATYRFVEPIPSLERYLEGRYGRHANAGSLDSYQDVDFVTLLDVLEHQEDDRRFLGELVQGMSPGAVLMLTVPAFSWLWSGWDVALGHHRRYDLPGLAQVWRGLPVRAMEASYLFPELLPAALMRRWRRPPIGEHVDEASFPDLPASVNEWLYRVGRASLRLRSWWPGGTSLFAALRRR
jgi:SAM-dependent methyltransferase